MNSTCLRFILGRASRFIGRDNSGGGEERRATIRIDLQEEKAPVSPTLYGIFMEEISHAFDGGIYAELIQNRSFEEGVLPPGMKLVKKPDGGLKMELETLPAGRAEGQMGHALAVDHELRLGPEPRADRLVAARTKAAPRAR